MKITSMTSTPEFITVELTTEQLEELALAELRRQKLVPADSRVDTAWDYGQCVRGLNITITSTRDEA